MSAVPEPPQFPPGRLSRPWVQGLLTVVVAAAAVYLISNHWLHVLDALPYLWVVLMMGMHLFMHGGHGGHGGAGRPGAGKGPGMSTDYGYDLWWLVILNSAVFIIFAFSFVRPRTKLDWRALGGFSAFIVALFTEMYGFPLTIYLLSGWLGNRLPGLDLLNHNSGHLWQDLTGWQGDPHLSPLHLLSNVLIAAGFILLYRSWQVLFAAQRDHRLATTGPYGTVRHPQYAGFLTIMAGFLLQWPTLLTLLMFPILVIVYLRLARKEERMMDAEFGEAYAAYRRQVPGFLPRFGRRPAGTGQKL